MSEVIQTMGHKKTKNKKYTLTKKAEKQLFCCYLVVENVNALIIIDAQASTSPHNSTAQVSVPFHIGQEQYCR